MEWLSAENVIAVVTAALGIIASLGVLWYERRVPRRTRIGYRVQLDTPVSSAERTGRAGIRLGLFQDNPQLSDATLVLLRIENDGSTSIADSDYTGRELHGLTAEFTDRTVRGVAVTTTLGADHLLDHFSPAAGLRHAEGAVYLPRVPLNRGQHFKLLVLLTGGAVGDAIRVSGGIRDGGVYPNRSPMPDDTPPVFSRATRMITVLLTACVVVLASIIVVRDDVRPPMGCAKGELTITGSTAFEPVAEDLAAKYMRDCVGSTVTVDARGSQEGLQELKERGGAAKGGPPALIALSDVPKGDDRFPELSENPVAVSVYTLVVNDKVTLRDLKTEQVRALYRGDIGEWHELRGGPKGLPVILASRKSGSGTRDIFRDRVLGGVYEPAYSSADCGNKDDTSAKVFRCELDSTDRVLATVARTDGAIGYTELRSGAMPEGLHTLSLNGETASPDTIADGDYPFREVEYAYTYGNPPADSLVASFLNYLLRGSGQDVVRTHGHLPCSSPKGQTICAGDAAQ
ncbi:substrate-binding domain-containing protein [Streptomyces lushanensis]|uniref:substrate-binding domain-containing protein n=1 Tax=Streptomyces lushanensis TaxID=1434255 RepID=UPI0008309DBF|nr:substrate-binding domain-containing protein [Streptomyces lushanensis]